MTFAFGVVQLNPAALGIATAMNEPEFFGPTDDTGFGGGVDPVDNDPNTQGAIESRTHGLVHVAVGGQIGTVAGAMSEVPRAAFDPIFWVHHAMIDRLWANWTCMPGKSWGSLPPAVWFDEAPWSFHDHDGQVGQETRRFFLTYNQLEYTYDDDEPSCKPLAVPSEIVAVAPTNETPALLEKLEAKTAGSFEILDQPLSFALDTNINQTLIERVLPPSFFVEIGGLQVEGVPPFAYDVYVSAQPGAGKDRGSPAYVGTLPLFGLSHHSVGGKTIRLNATNAVMQVGTASEVFVEIEPVPLLIPTTEPLAIPESIPKTEKGPQKLRFTEVRLVSR